MTPEFIKFILIFVLGAIAGFFVYSKRRSKKDTNKKDVDTEFGKTTIHQLRSSFTTIDWVFEKILDEGTGSLNETQKEAALHGKKTVENAINLINNTFSALDPNRIEARFKFAQSDIYKVIEDILSEYTLIAKARRLDLTFDKPKDAIPQFFFDSSQMYLALHDLIYNAIKYTKDGGNITVKLEKNNGDIKITVKDTGIGIPADQMGNLFNKYFRAENAKKIYKEGYGLGLFIVKNIITRHGGKIEVKSIEGEGTTFEVTIPFAETEPKNTQ